MLCKARRGGSFDVRTEGIHKGTLEEHPYKQDCRFTASIRASPELLARFTAACAARDVVVVAAANAKGAIEVTRAGLSAGAPAGVIPWDVVKAVAPAVFGRCTSVAAAKGGAPRTISTHMPATLPSRCSPPPPP